ncbi:hypothetical protein BH11PAT1_BH11PAT1_3230 [soil metagenome]
MVFIKKQPGESDDALIRKFSRKVSEEQIIQEARRRQVYLKPSQRKKAEIQEARKAARRKPSTT